MSPADLKTMREAVGLTVSDLASMAGVQERTVRYWESGVPGRSGVPEDAAELVTRLDHRLTVLADQLLVKVLAQGNPTGATLLRFKESADLWHFIPDFRGLPVTTHGALLSRCRLALEKLNHRTRIVYMDPKTYALWLDDRVDTESMRQAWAELQ